MLAYQARAISLREAEKPSHTGVYMEFNIEHVDTVYNICESCEYSTIEQTNEEEQPEELLATGQPLVE